MQSLFGQSRFRMCFLAFLAAAGTMGCVHPEPGDRALRAPLSLVLIVAPDERISATYRMTTPIPALHFAEELGGYRAGEWRPTDPAFRWVTEGDGERIERTDGASFDQVTLNIAMDYRPFKKGYANFSPFSEGSVLIHSGQFHACLSAPCDGTGPLAITITAAGKAIGVGGQRFDAQTRFVSGNEGTNIFAGTLAPVDQDGLVAIIDPGLPDSLRAHLQRSLPLAIAGFAGSYGPLSFRPELYVSIDSRPAPGGNQSTQGGTLPNQVFMHFDGSTARERLATGSPFWLDWFFAHEAAHLFQQDKSGTFAGENAIAWIHEGGADAMAALALAARGAEPRAYVLARIRSAEMDCARGLAQSSLREASTQGNFDLHYQCGLLIWLALGEQIRASGGDGLVALNRAFFARVRAGAAWSEAIFIDTARKFGASSASLARIEDLIAGRSPDPQSEVAGLASLALRNMERG